MTPDHTAFWPYALTAVLSVAGFVLLLAAGVAVVEWLDRRTRRPSNVATFPARPAEVFSLREWTRP